MFWEELNDDLIKCIIITGQHRSVNNIICCQLVYKYVSHWQSVSEIVKDSIFVSAQFWDGMYTTQYVAFNMSCIHLFVDCDTAWINKTSTSP